MVFTIVEEISFWGLQIEEHCLFLKLGLVDDNLRERSKKLYESWKYTRENKLYDTNLNKLLEETLNLKDDVIYILESGEWIGWLFPGFIAHTRLELLYFMDKLDGIKYSSNEETEFWNKIVHDHADFTSHLLDPSEKEFIKITNEISEKTDRIDNEGKMFIVLALKYATELYDFHKESEHIKIASIIHKTLLAHVIREEKRAKDTLGSLIF